MTKEEQRAIEAEKNKVYMNIIRSRISSAELEAAADRLTDEWQTCVELGSVYNVFNLLAHDGCAEVKLFAPPNQRGGVFKFRRIQPS